MAAPAADPEVDLTVDAGDGLPTVANINAAGPGAKLKLDARHWLFAMSGGETQALWSQLDAAFASALYFDADALDGINVVDSALSRVTCVLLLKPRLFVRDFGFQKF